MFDQIITSLYQLTYLVKNDIIFSQISYEKDDFMQKIFVPGSYDPFHNGHLELVRFASQNFESVIVGVANPEHKTKRFSRDQMMIAMAEVFEQHNFSNIDIVKYEEPMPEVVVELKADCILRGFRSEKDIPYEVVNYEKWKKSPVKLPPVIYVYAPFTSSTYIYNLLKQGKLEDARKLVPLPVFNLIK